MDDDYTEVKTFEQSMTERMEKVEADLAHISKAVYFLTEKITYLRLQHEQIHTVYGGTYSR